jgi:hypothetical protein
VKAMTGMLTLVGELLTKRRGGLCEIGWAVEVG